MWCRNGSGLMGESNKSKVMGSNPIHITKQTLKIKTMLKKTFQFTLLALFLFSICYLLGAFIETSFDITKWHNGTRSGVGIMGGFFSLVISGFITFASSTEF